MMSGEERAAFRVLSRMDFVRVMLGLVLTLILVASCDKKPEPVGSDTARKPVEAVDSPVAEDHVAVLASPEGGLTHEAAMEKLVALGQKDWRPTADQSRHLLAFINGPKPAHLEDGEWEERVNFILNLLRRQAEPSSDGDQGTPVPGLTEALLQMAETSPNEILRLYAIQHLALWYPMEPERVKQEAIVSTLQHMAERPDDPRSGAAVLMLADLQSQRGGNNKALVEGNAALLAAAERLLTDTSAAPAVRLSAVLACVDLGHAEVLPELRRIAKDPSAIGALRKAAIQAIGQLGMEEDLEFLDALPGDDAYLSQAIRPAMEKLMARLKTAN
jgi:hypothetical protein